MHLTCMHMSQRAAAYAQVLSAALCDDDTPGRGTAGALREGRGCLALGDGHWLALAAVEAGAAWVVDIEATPRAMRMASDCFVAACLPPSRVRVWHTQLTCDTVSALLDRAASAASAGAGQRRGAAGTRARADSDDECAELEVLGGGGVGLGAGSVSVVVADPFFLESHLGAFAGGGGTQWNNLIFWTHVQTLRPLLSSSVKIVPCAARVVAVGECEWANQSL
jgi:hypothetical protein